MKKILFIILFFSSISTYAQQQIPALSMDDVIHYTSSKDTLYIINFWATWCPPCVAELPEFNSLKDNYADAPVKILLVSLDFKEDYPKLARFVERRKLTPEIAWLSDSDPNVFIPKVDNSWQGSIPATVIVRPGKGYKKFIEGAVTERQVKKIVDQMLAQ